jgi:hypothetical protein
MYACIHTYIHTYRGILLRHKEKEILSFAGKWLELEILMLSELSQALKAKYHMF